LAAAAGAAAGFARRSGGRLERRRRPGDFAVLDDGQAADGVVFHIDVDDAVLCLAQFLGEAEQVGGVQRRRLLGQARGQVGVADDGHAVLHYRLARLGQLAVAAPLGRHVDDHAARLHAPHHLGGNQPGCRLAGNQRGSDDDVHFPGLLGVHLALGLLEALAHHLGIAAAAGTFLLVIDLDELAAQGHDLVGHFGTGVVGAHDGAQAGRRADRGQAGDSGAGDEDLGRRHLARGRDLSIEEATEGIGGLDDGTVAGDAGLGSQRIHLLGAGELARQRVDGQHGSLFRRQLLHQFRVLRRPDEADQGAAFAQERDILRRRYAYFENDVGRGKQFGGAFDDLGACGAIAVVTAIRGIAGPGFDRDREAQLDEFFDNLGYGGYAFFARQRFAGNSNCQRHDSPIHMSIDSAIRERLVLPRPPAADAHSANADAVPPV
jgi:hypothetical protein